MRLRFVALVLAAATLNMTACGSDNPGDKTIDTEMLTGWEAFWSGLDTPAKENACSNLQADRDTINQAGTDINEAAPEIFPSPEQGKAFFAWVLVTKC